MSYSVVIPSSNERNLSVCIEAITRQSNPNILVVADGPLQKICAYPGVSPFVFSRNVNIGIRACGDDDVILMNDDAVLVSGSLDSLMESAYNLKGIVSASVRGAVNNPEQQERPPLHSYFPRENSTREIHTGYLAFVCVAIPRSVINHNGMGLLDERFTTYGGEDVDYCHSARVNGIPLAVSTGCVVDHGNLLPSTFRRFSVPDIQPGLDILKAKWDKIRNTPLPI